MCRRGSNWTRNSAVFTEEVFHALAAKFRLHFWIKIANAFFDEIGPGVTLVLRGENGDVHIELPNNFCRNAGDDFTFTDISVDNGAR